MPFTTASRCQPQVFSESATSLIPRSTRTSNYAPSISSVISSSSTLVPEAHQQRGFKTREAYLAALEEFAEGHLYMPTGDHTIKGFYGDKTMDFYMAKPSLREDRRKRREQEAREKERGRTLSAIHEDNIAATDNGALTENSQESPNSGESSAGTSSEGEVIQQGRRKSRLGKMFGGRRGTVG